MKYFCSLALVALVAATSVHGAAVKPRALPPLKFLGEFQSPSTGITIAANEGQATIKTSYYFLSQNAAGFANAESDCKASLGPDSTLLYVETAEELQAVNDFLQGSDDTGSTYWVGGKYDVASKKFVWGNGAEIQNVPWDAGYPDTRVPITRVSANTVGGLKLRTQFQTVSNRYICELQLGSTRTNGLKYLGQLKDQSPKIGINGFSTRQTSFYFLSQNAAAFQTAENDCKAFLGEDASLLYIETREELGNVTEFLASSDDTGSTYWVGGSTTLPNRTLHG